MNPCSEVGEIRGMEEIRSADVIRGVNANRGEDRIRGTHEIHDRGGPLTTDPLSRRVEAVRRFNRFYTRQIGLLEQHLADSPFSLSEARILHEVAHEGETTATHLTGQLGLTPGYVSRIVGGFEEEELVQRRPSPEDRRHQLLSLTAAGKKAHTRLNASAAQQIRDMLEPLDPVEQRRLVGAMGAIEEILEPPADPCELYLLRPHRPGDMGWVVHRHGVIYNQEYGWDERFEALVAGIVARFIQGFDPERERCWIAERDGRNVGSVLLVKHRGRPRVAQLRLLLVEPSARGLGIGRRLVEECTRFARSAGYRKITLWTDSLLHAARRLYEREGYRLVRSEPHHSYGADLEAQDWELEL